MAIEVLHNIDLASFMRLLPRLGAAMDEWRMVDIRRPEGARGTTPYIARKLRQAFSESEGVIFLRDSQSVLAFICTGTSMPPEDFAAMVVKALPQSDGSLRACAVTADHLLRIQMELQAMEAGGPAADTSVLRQRQERIDDVVMIVDDDMLMRTLIEKSLSDYANVIALEDVADAVDTYLMELPDMVFLDVHMPGGSGMAALEEILTFDPSAHVVMLSSDTVVDRIMDAKKYGAKGYIAKPFTPEKLLSSYNKCPTVLKRGGEG